MQGEMYKLPASEMNCSPRCLLNTGQRTGGLAEGQQGRKAPENKPINFCYLTHKSSNGQKSGHRQQGSSPPPAGRTKGCSLGSSSCPSAAPASTQGEGFSPQKNQPKSGTEEEARSRLNIFDSELSVSWEQKAHHRSVHLLRQLLPGVSWREAQASIDSLIGL